MVYVLILRVYVSHNRGKENNGWYVTPLILEQRNETTGCGDGSETAMQYSFFLGNQ
jgi:hypothetical protein